MTKKKSRKTQREAQKQAKKQGRLMIAGIGGVLIVIIAAFFILQGQGSGTDTDTSERSEAPEVGALAPDFQLASNNDEQVNLSDFRGRPVAVTFMHTW